MYGSQVFNNVRLSTSVAYIIYMPTGSLARGDDTPESDLDIYIETVSLTRQKQQIIGDILSTESS